MSNCNSCDNNPCGCNKCEPARYTCGFNIQADPFDSSTWLFDFCGQIHRVKIPKLYETCTNLSTNFSTASLIYNSECGQNVITGSQLGELINLEELRDVDADDADSCDLLVFDPGCTTCGNGCKPRPAAWRNYHIPDAGDCEMEAEDGFYKVLTKDDCGCIRECKLPVVPKNGTVVNYERDSVPDDPDFPWYYGNYNDKINLHLEDNYPEYFGKYDLKITVNYGIQAVKSDPYNYNYNWRSIIVPVIEGDIIRTTQCASILQNFAMAATNGTSGGQVAGGIPWGTTSLRGSIVFIVPKGKEAYLHHEYRIRSSDSFPGYKYTPKDGQKVPDEIASQIDKMEHPASRLNALQVVVEPISGVNEYAPKTDPYRNQLDAPTDTYQGL